MTAISQVSKNTEDDWLSEDYFLDADNSKSWSESISTCGLIQRTLTQIKYYEDDTDNSWVSLNSTHTTLMTSQCSSPGLAAVTLDDCADSDAVVSEMTRASNSRSSSSDKKSGKMSGPESYSSRKSRGGEKKSQSSRPVRSSSAEGRKKIEKNAGTSPSNKRKRKENARKGMKKKRKRKDEATGSGNVCTKKKFSCCVGVVADEPAPLCSTEEITESFVTQYVCPDLESCDGQNNQNSLMTESEGTQCVCADIESYEEKIDQSHQDIRENEDLCNCRDSKATVQGISSPCSTGRCNQPETRDACEQTLAQSQERTMIREEVCRRHFSYTPGKYALSSRPPRCPRSRNRTYRKARNTRISRENSIVRQYYFDSTQGWTLDRTSHMFPVLSHPDDVETACMSIPPAGHVPSVQCIEPQFISAAFDHVQDTMDEHCPSRRIQPPTNVVSYDPLLSLSPISLCGCAGEEVGTQYPSSGTGQIDQSIFHGTCPTVDPSGGKNVVVSCSCTSVDVEPRTLRSPTNQTTFARQEQPCSKTSQTTCFSCSTTMTEETGLHRKDVGSTACGCNEAQTQTVCETGTCTSSDDVPCRVDKEISVSETCEAGTTVSSEILGPCSLRTKGGKNVVKCETSTSMSSEGFCRNALVNANPQCVASSNIPKPASESCVSRPTSRESQKKCRRVSDTGIVKQKLHTVAWKTLKPSQISACVRDTSTSPLPNHRPSSGQSHSVNRIKSTVVFCKSKEELNEKECTPNNNCVETCGSVTSEESYGDSGCFSKEKSKPCDCLSEGKPKHVLCTAQSTENSTKCSVQSTECGLERGVDEYQKDSTPLCGDINRKPDVHIWTDSDDQCNCSDDGNIIPENAQQNLTCPHQDQQMSITPCATKTAISANTEIQTEHACDISNQSNYVSEDKLCDCLSNDHGATHPKLESDVECVCQPVPIVSTITQTDSQLSNQCKGIESSEKCRKIFNYENLDNFCESRISQGSTRDFRRVNKRPWKSPCSSEVSREMPELSCKTTGVSPIAQYRVGCRPQSQKKKKGRSGSRSKSSKASSKSQKSCQDNTNPTASNRPVCEIPKRNRSDYKSSTEVSKTWIGHRICSQKKGNNKVGPRSSSTPGTSDRWATKVLGISMSQKYQACGCTIPGCSKRQDISKCSSFVSYCGWKSKQTMAICSRDILCSLSKRERKEMSDRNSYSINKEAKVSCGDLRQIRTTESENICHSQKIRDRSSDCGKLEIMQSKISCTEGSCVCITPEQDSNLLTCEVPTQNYNNTQNTNHASECDTTCPANQALETVHRSDIPSCSCEENNSSVYENSCSLPPGANESTSPLICSQPTVGPTNVIDEECTCSINDATTVEQDGTLRDSYKQPNEITCDNYSRVQQDSGDCYSCNQTEGNEPVLDTCTSIGDPNSAKSCVSEVPDTDTCHCSADESSTANASKCPSSVPGTPPCTPEEDGDICASNANKCLRESKKRYNKLSCNVPLKPRRDRRSRSKSRKVVCEIDDEKMLARRLHNLRIHSSTNVIEYPPCAIPQIQIFPKDCAQPITNSPCNIVSNSCVSLPPSTDGHMLNVCHSIASPPPVPTCTPVTSTSRIISSTTDTLSGQQVRGTMLGDGTIIIDYDSLCAAVSAQPAVQQLAGFTRTQDTRNVCHGASSLPTIPESPTHCMEKKASRTCSRIQTQETFPICPPPATPPETCTCWLKLEVVQSSTTCNPTPSRAPQAYATCQVSTPPIPDPCGTPLNVMAPCVSQPCPARIRISQPHNSGVCGPTSYPRTFGSVTQQNNPCHLSYNQAPSPAPVMFNTLSRTAMPCRPVETQNIPTFVIEYLPKSSPTVCADDVDSVPCRLVHSVPAPCDSSPCGAAPSTGAPCGPNPSCENPQACHCNLTCASRCVPEIRILRDNVSSGVACALDWTDSNRGNYWETETSSNYRPYFLRQPENIHAAKCLPSRDCGSTVTWDAVANARCASARRATAAATVACDHVSYANPSCMRQTTLYRVAPPSVQPCRALIRPSSQICFTPPQCPRKAVSRPSPCQQTWEYVPSNYRSIPDSCTPSEPEFISFYREVKYPAPGDACRTVYSCPTSAPSVPPPCRVSSTPSCAEGCARLPRLQAVTSASNRRASSHPFFAGTTGTSFNSLVYKSKRFSAGLFKRSLTLRKTIESRSLRATHDVSKERPHRPSSAGDARLSSRGGGLPSSARLRKLSTLQDVVAEDTATVKSGSEPSHVATKG